MIELQSYQQNTQIKFTLSECFFDFPMKKLEQENTSLVFLYI